MSTYLVTGVSRGIGWAFLEKLSSNSDNTVIGLVRNKVGTEKRVAEELADRSNIHLVEADLADYEAVKRTVPEVSAITGGSLDYIIANAGLITAWLPSFPMSILAETPRKLEEEMMESFRVNVIGNMNIYNLYMPLVLKGSVKKVITLSTGHADIDLATKYNLDMSGPYTISKAALNMTVAKYHATYADQGVLFMSISPGFVETGQQDNVTEEELPYLQKMVEKFISYAPDMKKLTPQESVDAMMTVIYDSSLKNGRGGAFISHKGTKRWL
ncbi:related to protoporphyrinogen oxidase [Cephalotrichum gorgonifer]|uniref:Related to protoporphyrinogen oxidase n=1 Tax=Cephalotrichum gorgonifer TaxID=2041049 RepID=A0AAE8N7P4_9PEZI|nr:related to protoporphyrinogen oxidase [Cephalotrichum gorgonifer]